MVSQGLTPPPQKKKGGGLESGGVCIKVYEIYLYGYLILHYKHFHILRSNLVKTSFHLSGHIKTSYRLLTTPHPLVLDKKNIWIRILFVSLLVTSKSCLYKVHTAVTLKQLQWFLSKLLGDKAPLNGIWNFQTNRNACCAECLTYHCVDTSDHTDFLLGSQHLSKILKTHEISY
jgi:hypothetical protein